MKLEINTTDKTVKLLDNYPLKDVVKELKKLVKDWDEYTLMAYEEKWNYFPYYPTYPWWYTQPYEITVGGGTGTGTYPNINIDNVDGNTWHIQTSEGGANCVIAGTLHNGTELTIN